MKAVVVELFFLVLFLLWMSVDMWITGRGRRKYSSRMAMWEDRAGGGEV